MAPFSIYLGWISVATIANFTVFLVDSGWSEIFNPQLWFVLVILVASVLAVLFLQKYHDTLYAAVIAWALVGIYWAWSARNEPSVSESLEKSSIKII